MLQNSPKHLVCYASKLSVTRKEKKKINSIPSVLQKDESKKITPLGIFSWCWENYNFMKDMITNPYGA